MLEWLSNFGNWLNETIAPFVEFFKSFISGLQTMVRFFPKITTLVANTIAYLPEIFAVFVSVSIIIYIAYIIIGRNTGGSE